MRDLFRSISEIKIFDFLLLNSPGNRVNNELISRLNQNLSLRNSDIGFSQDELMGHLGISRTTLSKCLIRFQRNSIVEVERDPYSNVKRYKLRDNEINSSLISAILYHYSVMLKRN